MKNFLENISLKELAAIVSEKLREYGIDSVLVGGACVSIYSHNLYESYDLDYVTYENTKKAGAALKELGFERKGNAFIHPNCQFFIEFVSPPVAIGTEPIKRFQHYKTNLGTIKMLTPTDSVKDRLAGYYHWQDTQSLEQAIAICQEATNKVNINEIRIWSQKEGFLDQFKIFYKRISPTSGA